MQHTPYIYLYAKTEICAVYTSAETCCNEGLRLWYDIYCL